MRRAGRFGRALLLVALAAGCQRPRTEIMLVIDTDLREPPGLDQVAILAELEAGRDTLEQVISVDPTTTWPLSLGLVPENGRESAGLPVVVAGKRGADRLVEQSVRTSFVEGKTLVLRVSLLRICTGILSCPTGMTLHCRQLRHRSRSRFDARSVRGDAPFPGRRRVGRRANRANARRGDRRSRGRLG
jgi:hypothetical protein